jgi:hypothetical protein
VELLYSHILGNILLKKNSTKTTKEKKLHHTLAKEIAAAHTTSVIGVVQLTMEQAALEVLLRSVRPQ